LQDAVPAFVDASGLPFATMFTDKSTLEEQPPAYIGMYDGKLMDEAVREFVESRDSVVLIGTILSDFNTGAPLRPTEPEKTIDIRQHRIRVGTKV
jgi:indolepyruvate decarboxylase